MMFRHRHPLHALQGLQALQQVVGAAHHLGRGAHRIGRRVPLEVFASRRAARRSPSLAHIFLAGLAVLALVGVMTQERRARSRPSKLLLGAVVVLLGLVVLSLRRSGRRYRL